MHWGKGAPRRRTSEANWKLPMKWQREAVATGVRPRVFCASLADWLDDEVPIEWLADLLELIEATPHLDWLLLTKRPQNWRERMINVQARMLRDVGEVDDRYSDGSYQFVKDWLLGNAPENVWIGTTVENQEQADLRIPKLLEIPAKVRFLSCEPLLGPVDLAFTCFNGADSFGTMPGIDWVICGGESGHGARAMHVEWARSLRDQCKEAEVPFLFKQWGEWLPMSQFSVSNEGGCMKHPFSGNSGYLMCGKKKAGRLLDGREWNEFPKGKC